MKRIFFIGMALIAVLALIAGVALWLFLSSWIPTHGKTRLIQALEAPGRFEVAIGAMRYQPFRGFILEQVRVDERTSHATWMATPIITARLNWMALLQRQVAFRARSPLELPCQTTLMVSGRYDLRQQTLQLHVRTTGIRLHTISPVFSAYLPSALSDGAIRVNLQFTHHPQEAPRITARIDAEDLLWATPTYRATANLTLDGHATLPSPSGTPLQMESLIAVHDGTLESISLRQTVSHVHGRARLTTEALRIEDLIGDAMGSSWRLEGTLTPLTHSALEALLTSRAQLAPLLAAFPSLTETWNPAGDADLRIGCHGALHPTVLLDCLARAEVRDATLTVPNITSPITNIVGSLGYDGLTRRLSMDRLRGRLLTESLSARGDILLTPPVNVSLDLNGSLPLQTLTPWLPQDTVEEFRGVATVDLHVEGSPKQLRPIGRIELRQAHARFPKSSTTIDDVHGTLLMDEERLQLREVSLQWNEQPVAVTATLTLPPGGGMPWRELPRIVATVDMPQGELTLAGRVTPEQIVVEESRVALERSRVQMRGTVERAPDHLMAWHFSGIVDAEELHSLSLLPLPILKAWKIRGIAEVDGQARGPWGQWSQAALQARVRANRLSVRDLPIEELVCQVEHAGRVLRLQISSAFIAAGKSWGQLTIDNRLPQQTSFLLEADAVSLQLEQLARILPAWRNRSMNGAASAHVTLSGGWRDRSTWRGEGWLNASGDHLGDIPLLDRFFQGGVLGPLAEWLGLDALRRAELTQASLHWRLAQQQLSTQDLRLAGLVGTAAVVMYVKGTVDLDQRVDVVIEPELSEQIIMESRVISGAASLLKASGLIERFMKLIRYRVTGTLKNPIPRFEVTSPQELLKQLFSFSPGDLFPGLKQPSP